jgi:hypothetical protein
VSNALPFALFDVLVCGCVGWWLIRAVQDLRAIRRRGSWPTIGRVFWRTATVVALAYLAFLTLWGFNYRRTGLSDRIAFDARRVSRSAAVALAVQTVDQLNALFSPAHQDGWRQADAVDPLLSAAFAKTQRALSTGWQAIPARPKRTVFDLYFRRAGVAGMTDPYFLETLVATDLLPFERPFVVAHEWSHLAGIADEGDANFAGWVICMQAGPADQYSAWLFLFDELASALPVNDMRVAAVKLQPGPRGDLQAIRTRLQRNVNPTVSAAGWRVYDRYLKANRVEEGAASYRGVVRLLTGTQFDPGWVPRLRR